MKKYLKRLENTKKFYKCFHAYKGQAYELRMKKLGDLSAYRSKKLLKCVLRICFHERRLQYMEAEQISEWSLKHPGERIIDLDLPLSYGVYDPHRDNKNINCLSFKWDPTRGKL